MTKKEKAKKLLEQLNSLEKKKSLGLQSEITNLTDKLKENFAVKALKGIEKIAAEVEKFKADFNPTAVMQAVKALEQEVRQGEQDLRDELNTKLLAIPQTPDLTEEVKTLQTQFETKIQDLGIESIKADIENFKEQLQTYIDSDITEDKIEQVELDQRFAKLRTEINSRLTNLGGGQAAPQLLVGGNESKKYKDVNFKAGANITLTIADNNTTKRNEITITSTGGGPGGGITRSIQSISASQAADATTSTDYVYVCTSALTLTMPTAVSNTNLYTIKNASNGTITVNFTGVETGDGQTTLTMPVKYTSIDLSSDGVSNWQIT